MKYKKKIMRTTFELNDKEIKRFDIWKKAIKEIYGEYGMFDFTFSPTGIGTIVKVYSHLIKKEIDITDLDSW